MNKSNPKKITIVGGGITGLAAAYIAAKHGTEVTVLEAGDNFGGLLATFPIGSTKLEYFYHHFFTHDAEIHWLLKELNLEDKLFYKQTTMGIFNGARIWDFNGPADLLKFAPLGFISKMRFALSSLYLGKYKGWENCEDISAAKWLKKYAGKQAYDAVWGPLLKIKFGPYAEEVPLAWMVGRLRQRMGSRKGHSDERLGYIQGSLDVLLEALLKKLNEMGVNLVKNAPVQSLLMGDNGPSALCTLAGNYSEGSFLFTIPSPKMAELMAPIDAEYASKLQKIKYFGAVCIVIELDRQFMPVYWLNVAEPNFPFGGIIEQTNFLPKEDYGNHIIYLSRYFAHSEEISNMSTEQLQAHMLPHLKKIRPDFDVDWIQAVHVFKTNTAATVCDLDFSDKIPSVSTPIQNVYYAGMPHVYPDERSVNNSIRVAAEACKTIGLRSVNVPYGKSLSGKIGMH